MTINDRSTDTTSCATLPVTTPTVSEVDDAADAFVRFALAADVLRFGRFRTKAGRDSPYFFNAGLLCSGVQLMHLGEFYAQRLLRENIAFDMLFGPAYKGISLAAATVIALARLGKDVPFAYNRKEAKDHGEGGVIVGAPLRGRVVIVDDVISAGTSVDESVGHIQAAGAVPAAVLIALDRQERAGGVEPSNDASAAQVVSQRYAMPVLSVASLDAILAVVGRRDNANWHQYHAAIDQYRARYGMLK